MKSIKFTLLTFIVLVIAMAASWPTGPSGDSIILENGQLKVNNANADKKITYGLARY